MTPYLFVGLPLHIQRFYSKKTEIASMRVREIIKIVESEIEISFEESDTTCRKRELADARHAFCYYIRNYSVLSLKKIGRLYKQNRDHTTIINSIKKVLLQINHGNPDREKITQGWDTEFIYGFVEAKDEDYDFIRTISK